MRWSFVFRNVFPLGLILLLLAVVTQSQTGTTSLHGVVTDKTGAAISGATVRLSNPAQGLERRTTTG